MQPSATSRSDRLAARVRLRPTMQSDLEFVLSIEHEPVNRSEGFLVEGTLREAVRTDEGFASLVAMSMLQAAFVERRRQALELQP